LRDFTQDRHKTTDDLPFGGGGGMVMKPDPIFKAVEAIRNQRMDQNEKSGMNTASPRIILLSPQGRTLNQTLCNQFSQEEHLILICGRYSGVDERVRKHLVTDEISIGDYILSGGEICAMVLVETVIRLIPGALGNEESSNEDSFQSGLLDGPRYTRPQNYQGLRIPNILVSGDHSKVKDWKRREVLRRTLLKRPDLLKNIRLTDDDRKILKRFENSR
jgi:tRNA (guanine37-N1)-methyltransferase